VVRGLRRKVVPMRKLGRVPAFIWSYRPVFDTPSISASSGTVRQFFLDNSTSNISNGCSCSLDKRPLVDRDATDSDAACASSFDIGPFHRELHSAVERCCNYGRSLRVLETNAWVLLCLLCRAG
jgi:hypothetical protein